MQPLLLPRSHINVIFVEKPYCLFPQNIHLIFSSPWLTIDRGELLLQQPLTGSPNSTSGGKVLIPTTTSDRRNDNRHQDNRRQGNRQLDQLDPHLRRVPLGERQRTRIRPTSAIRLAKTLQVGTARTPRAETTIRPAVTAVTAVTARTTTRSTW